MRRVATVVFVALACAIATASLTTVDADASPAAFEAFASRFGKSYESETARAAAYGHFVASVKQMHDMRARNPHAAFELNARSDMPPRRRRSKPLDTARLPVKQMPSVEFPAVMDWRLEGVLPPVGNMGQCGGACVAFSFTGMGTAINQIKHYTSEPVELSAEQLIACSPQECGCDEGCLPSEAYQALVANHGDWDTAASYNYTSRNGEPASQCKASLKSAVVGGKATGLRQIEKRNPDALTAAVLQSPVAVGVDMDSWQTYTSGVLTDCAGQYMDSMALLVGYNNAASPPYWILRNQWGVDWGMEGYIYIAKGNNSCGVQDMAVVLEMAPFA